LIISQNDFVISQNQDLSLSSKLENRSGSKYEFILLGQLKGRFQQNLSLTTRADNMVGRSGSIEVLFRVYFDSNGLRY